MTNRAPTVKALLVAAAMLLCLTVPARAETVELRDGRILEGKVSADGEGRVVVRTADGVEVLERSQVIRVNWDIDVEPEQRRDANDRAGKGDEEVTEGRGTVATAPLSSVSARPATAAQVQALRADLEAAAKDDETCALTLDLLQRMEGRDADARVAAMDEIAAAWPESRDILRTVLIVGDDQARLDAARLLRLPTLGDTAELCGLTLDDGSHAVRIQTLRAVHDKYMTTFEPRVRKILSGRAPWSVRQEAARTLERIGGLEALIAAFHAWEAEAEPSNRRRLKRLMRAIAGTDLGDDPELWRDTVFRAEVGEIKIRTPAERRPGRARTRHRGPPPRRAPRAGGVDEDAPAHSGD